MGILSPCVFYLDPNARLSTLSLTDEAKSQDFADSETHALRLTLQDCGGTVLSGMCGLRGCESTARVRCGQSGRRQQAHKARAAAGAGRVAERGLIACGAAACSFSAGRDRACGRRVRRESVHAVCHGQRGRRVHRRRGYQQASHREQVPFPSGVAGLDPSLPPIPLAVFPTKPLACVCSRSHPLSTPAHF